MDSHALIHRFLQEKTVTALPDGKAGTPEPYNKAGVVPFLREAPMPFFMMKPVAKKDEQKPPEFQICKGTRMMKTGGEWKDMRDSVPPDALELEPLIVTALREGMEEAGLALEHIARLYDIGPYTFASASTGRTKWMWLFAAEMASRDGFTGEVAESTAERAWLTREQFKIVGREDHRYIIHDIEARLKKE